GDFKTKLSVTCYTDTGRDINRDDHRSYTRYVFMMNEDAVDWKSSKKSTTAMLLHKLNTWLLLKLQWKRFRSDNSFLNLVLFPVIMDLWICTMIILVPLP
nr:hypothetical protein [Tanacetum cinerariifolium]